MKNKSKLAINPKKNLCDIPGIGTKLCEKLNKQNKIKVKDLTISEINRLPDEARLTIQYLSGNKFTYDEMTNVVNELKHWLDEYVTGNNHKYIIAGSYRRKEPLIKDIDIVIIPNKILLFPKSVKFIRKGETKYKILYKSKSVNSYIPVDILVTTTQYWPSAILYFTGSRNFNIVTRIKAREKGLILNEYGLRTANQECKVINCKYLKLTTEKAILEKIYGQYIKPEDRNAKSLKKILKK